jgi:hypothetical protein
MTLLWGFPGVSGVTVRLMRVLRLEDDQTSTRASSRWAGVRRRGHFDWEYMSEGKGLRPASARLQRYAPALESLPLLVVCRMFAASAIVLQMDYKTLPLRWGRVWVGMMLAQWPRFSVYEPLRPFTRKRE